MSKDQKEPRSEKFQMMLSPSEIEAIDDWSFKHRIRSRAETIRKLCQIALAVEADREKGKN